MNSQCPWGTLTRIVVGSMMVMGIADVARSQVEVGEIAADRPGFSDPPAVLPRGILHTEFGFASQWERHGDERRWLLTMGSPTVRVGIGRRTEIRFVGDGVSAMRTELGQRQESLFGHSDYNMGVKHRLTTERGARPAITVIPMVSMPVGHRRFSSFAFTPGVRLSMEKGLWAEFGLSGNLGWTSSKDEQGRFPEFMQSLSLDRDLIWGCSGFVEVYRSIAVGRAGVPLYVMDAGVSKKVSRNIAIDISAGKQVESRPDGWFIAVGIVIRHFLPGMMKR